MRVGDNVQSLPFLKLFIATSRHKLTKRSSRTIDWYVSNLSEILLAADFTQVKKFVTSTDRLPEDRNAMSKVALGAVDGLLRFQTSMQMEGSMSMQEVGEVIEEMKKEIDGGAYFRIDMHQFVAFKSA